MYQPQEDDIPRISVVGLTVSVGVLGWLLAQSVTADFFGYRYLTVDVIDGGHHGYAGPVALVASVALLTVELGKAVVARIGTKNRWRRRRRLLPAT